MNDRLSTCILAFAISLSVNPACTTAADPETLKRIDDQLTQLKDFEFGQNGNFIRDLENTIFRLPVDSSDRDVIEKKLVDAIEGANNIARGVICRQLRVIGTDRCVSSIAPLLSDLEVSPFARYALEGIGSEAALNAMHEALDRVPGQLQIGLLNSLSRVRYEPMRADCVRLSKVDDFQIASEAIRALGRLGGTEAIDSLRQLQGEVSKKLEQDVELALLACADRASSEGESDSAAEVYASIFAKSSTNRIAGLRGLVVAKPEQSVGILMDAISGEDSRLAASAIRMTTSLPGKTVTSRCVDLLEAIAVERKILLIKALGIRGDDSAVSAINVATQHPDSAVRLAAVEALGGLSGSEAVDTLIRAAADRNDQTVSRIARASLRRIADADSHLVSLAENGNETVAVEAMRALASRKASSATAAVIKLAQSSSTPKRRTAIEALGLLADPSDVKAVIDLAVESKVTDDQPKIEQALGRVLLKISSAEDRARPLLKALPKTSNENRGVLIRQLSKAGTPEALKAVRESIKSTDPATVTSADELGQFAKAV
ncbi:MAG: HEAT repeat domain-containing protein, partial [Planctomycetota bacterium]